MVINIFLLRYPLTFVSHYYNDFYIIFIKSVCLHSAHSHVGNTCTQGGGNTII